MNKKVVIIFTGGTISMTIDKQSNAAVLGSGPTDVLNYITGIFDFVDLETIEYSMKPSPSITLENMLEIGILVKGILDREDVSGVVITHGTDLIEETSYFLDLYLASSKPVVFTGSMRNLSELGYDGPSNLASAILVAASATSVNRGVLICLNDEINAASEVTKTHTVALDTFKSLEFGPLGIVDQRDVLYYRNFSVPHFSIAPENIDSNVEIVKAYASADSRIINFLVDQNVAGLVIDGLGRGNVTPMMVEGITSAISKNIPVVLTSRCPKGRVMHTYGYLGGGFQLRSLGVIFAGNLNAQKARIKLVLTLGKTRDIEEIREIFKK